MSAGFGIFWVSFFASALETVEAVALLAALGLSQGWRPPLMGATAAIVLLVVTFPPISGPLRTGVFHL